MSPANDASGSRLPSANRVVSIEARCDSTASARTSSMIAHFRYPILDISKRWCRRHPWFLLILYPIFCHLGLEIAAECQVSRYRGHPSFGQTTIWIICHLNVLKHPTKPCELQHAVSHSNTNTIPPIRCPCSEALCARSVICAVVVICVCVVSFASYSS